MRKIMKRACQIAITALLNGTIVCAAEKQPSDPDLKVIHWTVAGVVREAKVYIPKTINPAKPVPLVFSFHGHNNLVDGYVRLLPLHRDWPEAIVVYPQGLVSRPGVNTGKRDTGWQLTKGDQRDRDLRLFDAMLSTLLEEQPIDKNRIHCVGYSNGGVFACLLWQFRGNTFASVATVAGGLWGSRESMDPFSLLTPKPMMQVSGRRDTKATPEGQVFMHDMVKKINGCADEPIPWGGDNLCAEYPSKTGNPVMTFIHPGGHNMPKAASSLIVKFFKKQSKPQAGRVN